MSLTASLTILHVEDDPQLVGLVRAAFEGFGFRGTILSAGGVKEALDLLEKCARDGEHVSLILLDVQLPDGSGLDVLREVKSDPVWQMTPVIVLSGETAAGTINGAYALGANCYLPKLPRSKSPLDVLRVLHECWLKDAILPRTPSRDRLQGALSKAVSLRARSADHFLRLASVFDEEPEEMKFWLDRALIEGNMSNLLTFFLNRLSHKDVPAETIDRLATMQIQVKKALMVAEERLDTASSPSTAEVCRWVLDLTDALDEEVFAEVLAFLFPKAPVAAVALKVRAASQLKDLADHILKRTEEAELRERARSLLDWAERLAEEADVGYRSGRHG